MFEPESLLSSKRTLKSDVGESGIETLMIFLVPPSCCQISGQDTKQYRRTNANKSVQLDNGPR